MRIENLDRMALDRSLMDPAEPVRHLLEGAFSAPMIKMMIGPRRLRQQPDLRNPCFFTQFPPGGLFGRFTGFNMALREAPRAAAILDQQNAPTATAVVNRNNSVGLFHTYFGTTTIAFGRLRPGPRI